MLKENIEKDLKEAAKKKEVLRVQVLRFLLSSLHNQEIEKKTKLRKQGLKEKEIVKVGQLSDEEIISVISSEIKKRKEAILEFDKGSRQDLVEKETKEMKILQKYLPEQLSKEELEKLAKEAIEKVGAKELKDMGKVMAKLMPELRGRAEGKKVSEIVKELLSQPR